MATDATLAAIELLQNPKALELSQEVARLRTELATKQSEYNTAEAFLKTALEALDCKDPAKLAERAQKLQGDLDTARTRLTASEREVSDLKTERKGYETGRRDVQTRLEQLDAQLTATWMALPLSWRPADRAKLAESTGLFANGWEDLVTRQRETEGQLGNARNELRLANASVASLERTKEQLGNEVDALTEEVGQLTPRLPLWSRILFVIVGLAIVVAVSHRAGFDAAIAFRGGAK